MTIIDTHVHFWQYDPVHYNWIDESMQTIQQDFLPSHLTTVYAENGVNGCVAVEAHQSAEETNRLLQYALQHSFIKGVVGYVDLMEENIHAQLQALSKHDKLKGFRTALQSQSPAFMLQPAFLNGISLLQQYNFTFDLLILPKHLDAATTLVNMFPKQRFVIDHLAKPLIKDKKTDGWKQAMETLAVYENVYCKISGMVTEANPECWTADELKPYLDIVTGSFGYKRIMYGSDWPVCLVASSYNRWLQTMKDYFKEQSIEVQEFCFNKNATAFYNL